MDNNTRKLLGLTDENLIFNENWLEERIIKGTKTNVIMGCLTYRPEVCEKCGLINEGQIVKNGTHTTCAQLLPFRAQRTVLELKRTRFLCRECAATFNAKTPLIEERCHLSKELKYKIALDLKKNSSRKDIAEENFVSDATVTRVLRCFTAGFKPNFNYLPSVLCIDEFRSLKSSESAMSFICMDGNTNKIIEILENRQLTFLKNHFIRYTRKARLKVKYLVMDMNAPYAQLIKHLFPNAEIVTDRFHIIQHINRSFNQLRVTIMNQFRYGTKEEKRKYRLLKRFWRLLLKDSLQLDSSDYRYNRSFQRPMTQKSIVDELLSFDAVLKCAYETCQTLYYHYQEKQANRFFDELSSLDKQLPKWFQKKLTFFQKYKQGITNSFNLPYSNGPVEGTNNKIKVIKRVAYGYRNFINFRSRIYLIQGLIFEESKPNLAA